jgi:hypothetical protein
MGIRSFGVDEQGVDAWSAGLGVKGGNVIEDGKPVHWPKMLAAPVSGSDEQAAVRALAEVRRLIVAYRKDEFEDWRVDHAQTDYIVNVVAGLIADAEAIDALHLESDRQVTPLREKIIALEEQLAESKRPFTAQMEMQNNRIIGLNAEIERLKRPCR